jgi:hypothetical protein
MRIGRILVAQTVFDGYQRRWPVASYLWACARLPAAKQILDNGLSAKARSAYKPGAEMVRCDMCALSAIRGRRGPQVCAG